MSNFDTVTQRMFGFIKFCCFNQGLFVLFANFDALTKRKFVWSNCVAVIKQMFCFNEFCYCNEAFVKANYFKWQETKVHFWSDFESAICSTLFTHMGAKICQIFKDPALCKIREFIFNFLQILILFIHLYTNKNEYKFSDNHCWRK